MVINQPQFLYVTGNHRKNNDEGNTREIQIDRKIFCRRKTECRPDNDK